MGATAIEWTDAVWNPVTGCTVASAGCSNCYAKTFAGRRMAAEWRERVPDAARPGKTRLRPFSVIRCHEDRLERPLHWGKPRRVFVDSMGDLFHPAVPDAFLDRVFAVMALCPRLTFQVLTKRARRMQRYCRGRRLEIMDAARALRSWREDGGPAWPLPNVRIGVSVEDQAAADARLPYLMPLGEAGWFVWASFEPLLGPIDASTWMYSGYMEPPQTDRIQWAVVGGETGAGARRCDVAWIRSIVEQCRAGAVPVFVKQLGARSSAVDDLPFGFRSRAGKDPMEWPADLRVRELPK